MQAQTGGGGMSPSSHNPTLEQGEWSAPRSLRFTPRKYPIPILHVVSAARGQSGEHVKSRLHRDSIPGPRTLHQALYRLHIQSVES